MCQLLGLNANNPADIVFSFTGFRQRGDNTDDHKDGFGIAFFEQNQDKKLSLRSFYDDKPSAISPLADFISEHPSNRSILSAISAKPAMAGQDWSTITPLCVSCGASNGYLRTMGKWSKTFLTDCRRLLAFINLLA